ncbi:hypothetical protein AAVH_20856 [Aphelenchoides avenae]|nr:hypothetical protein AAVH_20856 [Aphelenchus avenae]
MRPFCPSFEPFDGVKRETYGRYKPFDDRYNGFRGCFIRATFVQSNDHVSLSYQQALTTDSAFQGDEFRWKHCLDRQPERTS